MPCARLNLCSAANCFTRTAQAVTLTEQGEAILPHAKGLLNVAHAAFADMQQVMAEGGDGTLRIGLIPSACALMFPLAAARLAATVS